ncbi:hypothetical protein LXL04_001591 [Taraxacum kok-saghyz]
MTDCHVVFFPFMAYGHMIPMADMAVLFASRGLKTTIITTPTNAPAFSKSIQKTINHRHQTALHIIPFNRSWFTRRKSPSSNFFENSSRIALLQTCFIHGVLISQPNIYNIPRIVFTGSGFFPHCVVNALGLSNHTENVSSDSEHFIVPHLPHEIMLTRKQLPNFEGEVFKGFLKVFIEAMEAEARSYGLIFNSFYELEREYVHHYREVMKRKCWHIGPVSLCNTEDKSERMKKSVMDEYECLKWLKRKTPDSVVYNKNNRCRKGLNFEERMAANGKGLIIKGWAPQVLILDHESVGGFVTHCGWNSVLEGVTGGVAMVVWPVMAEQFYNAKLVTDVLRIGVSIGDVEWSATSSCDGVKREAVEKAVVRVMGGEEGDEMRRLAKVLKEKAMTAVEEGGSSHSNLNAFIHDIKA